MASVSKVARSVSDTREELGNIFLEGENDPDGKSCEEEGDLDRGKLAANFHTRHFASTTQSSK